MQQQLVAHPVMPDVVVVESAASAAPLSNQSYAAIVPLSSVP
jgi:hypothetical protein